MTRHRHQHPAPFLLHSLLLIVMTLLSATGSAAIDGKAPTVKDIIEEQPVKPDQVTVTKAVPRDEFDRGTPRSSLVALAQALDDRDYERAMNYFDMRNVPPGVRKQGSELARELKIIADRSLWVDINTISEDPNGHKDDGLPSYRDIIARLKTPDGPIEILMQRVPDDKGGQIWKISNRTVSEIPKLYEHYGYGEFGDKLSRLMPGYQFLGLEIWQWVMLLGIGLTAFFISWLITYTLSLLLRLRKSRPTTRARAFLAGPIRIMIFVLLLRSNFDLLAPSFEAKAIFEANTLLILAITWMITGLIDLAFGRLSDRMRDSGNNQGIVLLRPAATLIKIIILLVAVISWLDNLGFDVTAMIAGLGVGGIAVGLAAQKSIENLIGAITLYSSQPVRIGDLCRVGSTLGVVEGIGLRSTDIRTLDRTLVAIPNASFANMDIENLTMRDKILYRHTIRLRTDTSPGQVRTILQGVRKMFEKHPDVDPVPARIRFTEYGEHSLNLEVFAYITTIDFNEYLASVEDLNLRILDIISAAGTQLALPARDIRLEGNAVAAT